ncbi:hypothetical protein GUJ93_ZPchr0006g42341 [Zizania palustris]|uniref:Uncharacterized protein n=1 Tax=Zizania palustris TaxID=103762 RepID=A0A8J5S775_ZIZPA|nr:hypothetical protein GUJ93_ZPchr0006g42341 [Zizania palustris]
MTVAESRRSRRLHTSPNAVGRLQLQATTSMIRCSSWTRCTVRRIGATISVKGSSQMPTSKISMTGLSFLLFLFLV